MADVRGYISAKGSLSIACASVADVIGVWGTRHGPVFDARSRRKRSRPPHESTMPHPPWLAERTIDAPTVESVVGAAFPDLAPVRARFLDDGWDSDAYLVNDAWVFRFPRRASVQAMHD